MEKKKSTVMRKIFETGKVPADVNGKRWYIVDTWFDYHSMTGRAECKLSDAVSLNGVPISYESERKVVVRVKNLLKGWGHPENTETICNALEYLWEEKKISGPMYMTLWTIMHKVS